MTFIVDGTNGLTFNNSTVQASAGVVLQVVNATYNTITSTTSASFVTTGLTASITPKFSTSKILVLINIPAACQTSTVSNIITIYRGSTNLALSTVNNQAFAQVYGSNSASFTTVPMNYLDSPATTSSTTYTAYFLSGTSGTNVQCFMNNETGTITLMEIAG